MRYDLPEVVWRDGIILDDTYQSTDFRLPHDTYQPSSGYSSDLTAAGFADPRMYSIALPAPFPEPGPDWSPEQIYDWYHIQRYRVWRVFPIHHSVIRSPVLVDLDMQTQLTTPPGRLSIHALQSNFSDFLMLFGVPIDPGEFGGVFSVDADLIVRTDDDTGYDYQMSWYALASGSSDVSRLWPYDTFFGTSDLPPPHHNTKMNFITQGLNYVHIPFGASLGYDPRTGTHSYTNADLIPYRLTYVAPRYTVVPFASQIRSHVVPDYLTHLQGRRIFYFPSSFSGVIWLCLGIRFRPQQNVRSPGLLKSIRGHIRFDDLNRIIRYLKPYGQP